METSSAPLDAHIEASAHILKLTVNPEWKGDIRAILEAVFKMAAPVQEFELPDDSEPAPVFKA